MNWFWPESWILVKVQTQLWKKVTIPLQLEGQSSGTLTQTWCSPSYCSSCWWKCANDSPQIRSPKAESWTHYLQPRVSFVALNLDMGWSGSQQN